MAVLTINNAACNVVIYNMNYGLLYNRYVVIDPRKISSSDDWIVITEPQWQALKTYIGSDSGKLKETGLAYWESPNQGATNEFRLGTRGYGTRNNIGGFGFINQEAGTLGMFSSPSTVGLYEMGSYNVTTMDRTIMNNKDGYPIVLTSDATGVTDGDVALYTGNDTKVYEAVAINGVYFVVGLSETRFRDNSIIPWYGADSANYFTNAEWAALTTAGVCAYNNTLSNVATGFTFPT